MIHPNVEKNLGKGKYLVSAYNNFPIASVDELLENNISDEFQHIPLLFHVKHP